MAFTSPMNWDTLRISPQSIERPNAPEKVKKVKKDKSSGEPAEDLPWN